MNVLTAVRSRGNAVAEPGVTYDASPEDPSALDLLRKLTGDPTSTFRGDQWDVIDAIVNQHQRVLLVQRTGWGKSAVYFISAKLLRERGRGLTLIVSPLLGLMRNQVYAGKRMGLRIGALHSGNSDKFDTFVDLVARDAIDVLLISPERFANDKFQTELLPSIAERLALLVIDEAHCISDWGHDFRPDYQRLSNVIAQLPQSSPILATTATANNRVVADVSRQLGSLVVSRGPLVRENLALQTLPTMSGTERLGWMAELIPTLDGKGLVYTLTTKDAETVAAWLTQRGISAHAYHGAITTEGLPNSAEARIELEDRFTNRDLKVLVATSALGMGYDNPDVRFVIHYQTPGSIIAYYQQVGRAGRGKDGAIGVLMSGPEDGEIQDYFRTSSLPSMDDVASILATLGSSDGMTTSQIMNAINMGKGRLDQALGFLAVQRPAPIAKQGTSWHRNPVAFDARYEKHRDELIAMRVTEWREINEYRTAAVPCRMNTLLRALDDPSPVERCGRCDRCLGHPVVEVNPSPDLLREAARFLNRPVINPIKPRLQVPPNGLPLYGFKSRIGADLRAEEGCVLTTWADKQSLRNAVMQGKASGGFDDSIVQAAASMIQELWQPSPTPTWASCVPSIRHTKLVPDLAHRIARKLGIPFVDCIEKVRETDPQKGQQNTFHQCSNLDGAFAISGEIPVGPVLLIDDMVDSGWTFTILTMLLRQAGSGPVFPFALVSTTKSDA
jgi:ATP-dependent DNA helicase RecQ